MKVSHSKAEVKDYNPKSNDGYRLVLSTSDEREERFEA